MNSLNSVLIEGNLTGDPKMSETGSGVKFCAFTVASDRYFMKDGEKQKEVSRFDVKVWNRTADLCQKDLSKGRGVRVVGRLAESRGQNLDGTYWSKPYIVGESVEFKTKFDKNPSEV